MSLTDLLQKFRTEPQEVLLGNVDGIIVSVLDGAAGLDEAAAVSQACELARRAGP